MLTYKLDDEASLRLLEPRHAGELFALVDANRDRLRNWLPWVDHNLTADDSRAFIEQSLDKLASQEQLTLGIWSGGKIAGVIGAFFRSNAPTAEIGYWLGEEIEGRGLITKAVEALLPYIFEMREMHRVEIHAAPENERSWRVPERLGFQLEGTLREAERLHDRFVDTRVYGLLHTEWQARSRNQ